MAMEEAILVTRYSVFLQTFAVISILLGIYGLTITTRSLQEVAPGEELSLEVEQRPHFTAIAMPRFFHQKNRSRINLLQKVPVRFQTHNLA